MKIISYDGVNRYQTEVKKAVSTNTIRKLGVKSLRFTAEERMVFVNACVKFNKSVDRYDYVCQHIPAMRTRTIKYFKLILDSEGYLSTAMQIRREMLAAALKATQDANIEVAKEILEGEHQLIDKLRSQLDKNIEALDSMELGSKNYMNVLNAVNVIKAQIDKLSGVAKVQQDQQKSEDAALGINIFKRKKEIAISLDGKTNELGGGHAPASDLHTNLDEDLIDL